MPASNPRGVCRQTLFQTLLPAAQAEVFDGAAAGQGQGVAAFFEFGEAGGFAGFGFGALLQGQFFAGGVAHYAEAGIGGQEGGFVRVVYGVACAGADFERGDAAVFAEFERLGMRFRGGLGGGGQCGGEDEEGGFFNGVSFGSWLKNGAGAV